VKSALDHYEMVAAAKNRQSVELADGSSAVLVSWGQYRDRSRVRVMFPNARMRTLKKHDVVRLLDF